MENLKNGDIVKIKAGFTQHFRRGDKFKIIGVDKNTVLLNAEIKFNKNYLKEIGESQMQYEESNRYKLAQAIQKTGISAKALSRAVVGNESYFYNKTGVARFNKKGDISNEVLNLALVDLAFAEREVLGIGAKTVEGKSYTAVINNKGDVVDIVKTGTVDDAVEEAKKALDTFTHNQPIEKPTSNKPLFIGAAAVIFIALILFILNNSQVV